ncbi:MAG TPA: hypothetical protein VE619_11305 [Nitrososphaeraceae archaeon]|nr:hypothetical protein [Nitrososphaeraceae archaeon]
MASFIIAIAIIAAGLTCYSLMLEYQRRTARFLLELYSKVRKTDDKVNEMSYLNFFIAKPIAIEELVKRINKIIITMDAG